MKKDDGVVKRAIVTPDKHAPLHDRKAISVLKQAIELVQPDLYIDLGDVGEWESVSHWKWKNRKKPPLEYIVDDLVVDIKAVNDMLDDIDESLDKAKCNTKHFIAGNHEEWLDRFVMEHPYLPQYTPQKALTLQDRGYTYHQAGKYVKMGKLTYYHGHHFGGQYHTANHLRKLGGSIMYGHFHSFQMMSATGFGGPMEAWCIGCLKDMSSEKNKWLKGRPHQWVHAFAIVDYYKGGQFSVTPVKIVNGQASVWGQLIKGDK